jgi:hypothetical protein
MAFHSSSFFGLLSCKLAVGQQTELVWEQILNEVLSELASAPEWGTALNFSIIILLFLFASRIFHLPLLFLQC